MRLRSLVLLGLIGPSGLSAQQAIPVVRQLDVGGENQRIEHELPTVTSAYRTASGLLVVGTSAPAEVRLYDGKGTLVRRLGRAGQGPGEFAGSALVRPWTGDSILALSNGASRWILYSSAGKLVREWPKDASHPYPVQMVFQGWTYSRLGVIGSSGCFLPALRTRPAPTPWAPREVLTDHAGRVWLRQDARSWAIHAPTGAVLGNVVLPRDFVITQFTDGAVVGHYLDDDDFAHVAVFTVTLPRTAAADAAPCAIPPLPRELGTEPRTMLGALRTLGEVVRAETGRYPASLPLERILEHRGVVARVLIASEQSWAVLTTETATGIRCLYSTGPHGLPGWVGLEIGCSRSE